MANHENARKTVYVDMDHVLCDFEALYKRDRERTPSRVYPQSRPGFFLELEPIDSAIAGFNYLKTHPSLDVYILTAPSVRNPHCYTEKRLWVEQHLGLDAAYKLIISPNKSLLLGDFLIDDYISGKGQEHFVGTIIHFGSSAFPDWDAVMQFFSVLE